MKRSERDILEIKKALKLYKEAICKTNLTVEARLTVEKRYPVLEELETCYKIKHDRNRTQWFSKGFFK